MDNEVPVITCSAQKMVFLAGLLGADSLLGVDDLKWTPEIGQFLGDF